MKSAQDKKKSNFIIACGYCLVVVVILINYLGKTSKRSGLRDGVRPTVYDPAYEKINDDLAIQLKEQKRMNKEMREMILDIQSASPEGSSASKKGKALSKAPQKIVPIIDMKSMTLPELSPRLETKFKTDVVYPVDFGRNPFTSQTVAATTNEEDEEVNFPGHAVICNPRLPYVFTGVNSNMKVISNY